MSNQNYRLDEMSLDPAQRAYHLAIKTHQEAHYVRNAVKTDRPQLLGHDDHHLAPFVVQKVTSLV